MEPRGAITGGLYRACEWIMRLAYLNLLWILFSVAGLFILGLFPSTAAMCAVIRKWLRGEGDTSVFQNFSSAYRCYFLKANVLGYILLGLGIVIFVDIRLFANIDGLVGVLLLAIGFACLFLYCIVLLYVFPVLVSLHTSLFQTIKYALLIGISSLPFTLLMGMSILMLGIVFFYIPALSIFFLGSAAVLVMMWITQSIFRRITKLQGELTS